MSTLASALSDSRVMIGREVRHDLRSIDALVTGTAMPVLILTMFVFVFGGAITTGTGHYVDYVVPGSSSSAPASDRRRRPSALPPT